ncbi:MAG: GNAT family N-acetyltransferase [Alphaproteobacteria bacterium]
MARITPPFSGSLRIEGQGVYLRPPRKRDFAVWAALRADSQAELVPFEPRWAEDELDARAFRRRLKIWRREREKGTGLPLLIFAADQEGGTSTLVGGIRLANLAYGVQQSGSVGYWVGTRFAGQGYMGRALDALIPFYFREMKMHRLEAACLSNNAASQRVLARAGFQREGIARQFLRINAQWQDHLRFAIVRGDPASTVKL